MKVLFVCLGNICRSPLAEAIFKHKLQTKPWCHQVSADSCGTSNYHIGNPPDIRTRENAAKNGVKMSHSGRQLAAEDLEAFDYIFAMDRANYNTILQMPNADHYTSKILLIRDFDLQHGHEVPDPYYGNEKDFQEVFDILDRSINGFIKKLDQELS